MSDEKPAKEKYEKKPSNADKKTSTGKKPMPKALKIILIVVAALIAFVAIILVVASAATKEAVQTSNRFFDSIQAGEGETAYAMLTQEVKDSVTEEDFLGMVDQIGPILNTDEKTISREVNKNDSKETGTVVYEVDGTDGLKYTVTVKLVKDNGQWMIENFSSNNTDSNTNAE